MTGNESMIVNGLAEETYYGFNMRLVLMDYPPEMQAVLEMFIADCKKARTK